jgi:hypothetical protein
MSFYVERWHFRVRSDRLALRGIRTHCFTRILTNLNYPEPHVHRLPLELLQQVFVLIVYDELGCSSMGRIPSPSISPALRYSSGCADFAGSLHIRRQGLPFLSVQSDHQDHFFNLCPILGSHSASSRPVQTGPTSGTSCCIVIAYKEQLSEADLRLLATLVSESNRWQTVVLISCTLHTGRMES